MTATGDATAAWLAVRGSTDWGALVADPGPVAGRRDGHRWFIETEVASRDPRRAARLTVALDRVRAWANGPAPFGLAPLGAIQAVVLGRPAPFPSTDAYAKAGRERYPFTPTTATACSSCLDEANDAVPAPARAIRVYLDLLFFHPFEDGNGRAAALAFDFVLTRAGIRLGTVAPLFVVTRWAADPGGPRQLARVLRALVRATAP